MADETCLNCGHDTPHNILVQLGTICAAQNGPDSMCYCTADRRTIAAQAAEIERLNNEVEQRKHQASRYAQDIEAQAERIEELTKELAAVHSDYAECIEAMEADHE